MASLHKLGKAGIYTAMWRDAKGKQWKRSTDTTVRKTAQEIAEAWEKAANTPPAQLTMQTVQRVMAEIYRSVTGQAMADAATSSYLRSWLEMRKPELGETTLPKYQGVVDSFIAFLEESGRENVSICELGKQDVLKWRDALRGQIGGTSVNQYLKILRLPFAQAKEDGLLAENPAKQVKPVKVAHGEKHERAPFKQAQLSQVLDQCDDAEWQSMVVHGYYTSQRLGDIALMKWKQIDLQEKKVKFRTGKRGTVVVVEMNDDYCNWILTQSAPDDPEAHVHPECAKTVLRTRSKKHVGTLSNRFALILWRAGLRDDKPMHKKKEKGPGRHGKRKKYEHTFHSLRHTLISDLANRDVSRTVVMDIVGHQNADVNRVYTHIDARTKRSAMKKLPNIIPGKKGKQLDLGLDGQEPEGK